MKKRDKSKRRSMNLIEDVVFKRKENKSFEILNEITKDKLESAIRKVFSSQPPIDSHWHDDMLAMQPKIPTESFRFDILDLSKNREVATKEPAKGPKLKLIL
jgi:hypothetical protein